MGLALNRKELSRNTMINIIENKNEYNRSMKPSRTKEFTQQILNGNWDYSFLEGNTLTFSHAGDLLSGQHRLQAMINAEVDSWVIHAEHVDTDWWLNHSVEKRTSREQAQMRAASLKLPKDMSAMLEHISKQEAFVLEPYSPQVKNHPHYATEDEVRLLYVKYAPKVVELHNYLAYNSVKLTNVFLKSLHLLYSLKCYSFKDVDKVVQRAPEIVSFAKAKGKNQHVFYAWLIHSVVKDSKAKLIDLNTGNFDGVKAAPLN